MGTNARIVRDEIVRVVRGRQLLAIIRLSGAARGHACLIDYFRLQQTGTAAASLRCMFAWWLAYLLRPGCSSTRSESPLLTDWEVKDVPPRHDAERGRDRLKLFATASKDGCVIVLANLGPIVEVGCRKQAEHVPSVVRIGFLACAYLGLLSRHDTQENPGYTVYSYSGLVGHG
jgi:hypothetical protein